MSSPAAPMCVVHSYDQPATTGYLCAGHLQRLATMLRDVEDEAVLLSAVPSMQVRQGSGKGSLASERAPARLEVLVHTDRRRGTGRSETDGDAMAAGETLSILDVLHSWARVVRDDRGLEQPRHVTITGERDLLSRHLDWIAGQPWVDETYHDVRRLLGQLRAANDHRPDRPYSHCPVIAGAENCVGKVWVQDELRPVWRRYTDRCSQTWEHAPGAAVCDTCGATWADDAAKARLKRMVADAAVEAARPRTDDGRAMYTVPELAQRWGISTNAVRLRLSKAGVKSEGGYYDADRPTVTA